MIIWNALFTTVRVVRLHWFENSRGGRLVFLCFRLLPDWTDLPTRNSFLPLMVELCGLTSDELLSTGRLVLQSGESIVSSEMSFNAINPGLFQYQGKKISVHAPLAESLPEVMTKNEILEVLNGSRSQTQLEDTELSEFYLSIPVISHYGCGLPWPQLFF